MARDVRARADLVEQIISADPGVATDAISARRIKTSHGTFRYRRLWTFDVPPRSCKPHSGEVTWRVVAQPRPGLAPLIGYLFRLPQDRCLARLGPGARVVALTSAALDSSCGSHMACVTRAPLERERLKRGLLSSK
jgi:hypothetical protein